MKYAILSNNRLTECVTVPPAKEGNPAAWLAVQFPTLSGWILVPDECVNGSTPDGLGGYNHPPAPPVITKPYVYPWNEFNKYIIGLLNPDGRSKLQNILEKARDFAGATVGARNVRAFYTWYVGSVTFDKAEVLEAMQAVTDVDATVISQAQTNAVQSNWKNIPND